MQHKENTPSKEDYTNQLLTAVKNNNVADVKRLLENGADANFIDPENHIPLLGIAVDKNPAIFYFLLKYKADPSAVYKKTSMVRYKTSILSEVIFGFKYSHLILLAKHGVKYDSYTTNGVSDSIMPLETKLYIPKFASDHAKIYKISNLFYMFDIYPNMNNSSRTHAKNFILDPKNIADFVSIYTSLVSDIIESYYPDEIKQTFARNCFVTHKCLENGKGDTAWREGLDNKAPILPSEIVNKIVNFNNISLKEVTKKILDEILLIEDKDVKDAIYKGVTEHFSKKRSERLFFM
ncbi:MAG: hypothetical protein J0G32_02335 [Alphaproteobacteria bacterium]|nr:hypothetical protein [Alphaproteobacteria bacterium]OJV12195.1 MAG: hypothetical protein BGO27_05600 [Alphaproteobacteria bacterium 33-17]